MGQQVKQFKFHYEGDSDINLNTLLTSQFHFLAIVNELQRNIHPETEVNLRVSSLSEGSFVIDFLSETTWIQSLFSKENVDVIQSILVMLSSFITIKQHLKGKKAQRVEQKDDIVIIINVEGNQISVSKDVYKLYQENQTINKSLSQNFELLEKDEDIQGVQISEKTEKEGQKPILKVDRGSFADLKQSNSYLDKEAREEVHANERVYIKKANLLPETNKRWAWDFIHKGRDIKNTRVSDQGFANKINDGLKVGQGDSLIVDLLMGYKWDERFQTFIESGTYEVVKVHEVIERPRDGNMFSDSENI